MAESDRTVLVTGATGTVGSEIAVRLVAEGFQVRALVRRPPVPDLSEAGVEPVPGDLTDRPAVESAVRGARFVVHAAAYIGSDWDRARAVNVRGTEHVAQAALAAGVERLVHISTGSVYRWEGGGDVTEDTPLWESARDAYAQSKADAERVVRAAEIKGLAITILRLGMVMSAHPTSFWGPKLIERMRAGMEWHPDDRISWVHVGNIPDAVLLALRSPEAAGEAYNLVDGDRPARDLYGRVAKWLGQTPTAPDRPPRTRRMVADKIRRLGYGPRRTFEDAMVELEGTAREQGWLEP